MNALSEISDFFEVTNNAMPFLGVAITFAVYYTATVVHRALGSPTFLHPLIYAIAAIALSLAWFGIPYQSYFDSAKLLHMLLGPVVVLLAVPLWRQLAAIRFIGPKLILVLAIGSLTGIATSAGVAYLFSAPGELIATLAPKSVTTPVAINLSENLGGIPAITAVVVILTGLTGATIGWPLLKLVGMRDHRAAGFALGTASHVIGTARVFQIDQAAGAFSSLGMIMNAIMTAILLGLAQILFF